MALNVTVPEELTKTYEIHDLAQLKKRMVEDLVLMRYIEGQISKRYAGRLLGLDYDGITDLLYERNIPSQMGLPDDLKQASKRSMKKLAENLGITLK